MTHRATTISIAAALPLSLMHAACFPEEPWSVDALERVLALAGAFGLLVWRGEEPVGFALARDLGGEVEVLSLGVMPQRRRDGAGQALLKAVATEAASRGASSLVLEVAEPNVAARRLYEGFGFARVGRRPHYYRGKSGAIDALILRCGLDGAPPQG